MKRIIVLILCVIMLLVPLSASAEESYTPENEIVTETESEPATEATGDEWSTITGAIKEWIEPNLEEISVVVSLIGYGILLLNRFSSVLKSMGTMNNNTITISKSNANLMEQAMASINNASGAVTAYDGKISETLDVFRQMIETHKATVEENKALEKALVEMRGYLKVCAEANLEFSNELAELIALANIPNYKKEELGARHVAAKEAILASEANTEAEVVYLLSAKTEVKENDGETKED